MQFVPRMPAKTEVQPLALLLLALSFSFFYAHVSVCLPRSTKRSARAAGPPQGNRDWRRHGTQNPTFLSRRLSVIMSVFWQSPCLPSTPLIKKWGFGKNLTPRASRHKRTPSAAARPRARTGLVQTEGATKERQQGLEKTWDAKPHFFIKEVVWKKIAASNYASFWIHPY